MKGKIDPWYLETFLSLMQWHDIKPIDEWAGESINIPSNTTEGGRYDPERCPYQKQPMRNMSADSPVKMVILVWGSQTGKTTVEIIVMDSYIENDPAPMAFGFSDDKNLKEFIKKKFDPMLEANPNIKSRLKAMGGRGSGNTLTSKIFPGGFIKFLSGKSEASLRSDSVRIFFGDELDAWGITKGGDPIALATKRTNTFGDRRKLFFSSTPLNDSLIWDELQKSTNNHYMVPCPCCGKEFEFSMDTLRWSATNDIVEEAWMECPHCGNIVRNEDKIEMLPKGRWVATNPDADPLIQGYYLPAFYAPVGWVSFKDQAQEYYNAALTPSGVDFDKMTVFYNTVLAMPYIVGSESQDWRLRYELSLQSPYRRGVIPRWVNVLTTASDVQGNRIETTLMGWGFRGRHITIDHYVFRIENDEKMDQLDNKAWEDYRIQIINGGWTREDGLPMECLANAMDRSYLPDVVSMFYISLTVEEKNKYYPVRGYERMTGFIPSIKYVRSEGLQDARYWDVPVNPLKKQIFEHLKIKDNAEETVAFLPIYPADYDQEFYMQLFSEHEEKKNHRVEWVKHRTRNEILDTHVYNYAMFYLLGLGTFKDEDWIGLAEAQQYMVENGALPTSGRNRSRILSKGITL